LPLPKLQNSTNTRFVVKTSQGDANYMAYLLDKQLYVRASVCPPCRSLTFTLDGNTLVCDRCATVFNAETGAGIKGACVNYPKANVPYTIADGKVVMKTGDLTTAFQNTLQPGLP
jgi:nitrite reductase/ring-hydroxylating ferredoxin subunit